MSELQKRVQQALEWVLAGKESVGTEVSQCGELSQGREKD